MSEDSDTTAPCSEENHDDVHLATILKEIGMLKEETKKIKVKRGYGNTLMYDSVNEMTQNPHPTCNRSIKQHMKCARFYMEFERASMCDIANFTTLPSKQSECIRIKEIQLADGDWSLTLSNAEKHRGSNTIIQYKREKNQHNKELTKDSHLSNVDPN